MGKTLKLTSKDFKKGDNYWSDYIGKTSVVDYDGDIEIAGGLGWVKFAKISLSGYLSAEAGTGIKAGEGIKAGKGIEAGTGIKAGTGIEAGEGIKAGKGIEAGTGIKAGWGIEAGTGIEAGEGIKAGWGIKAGTGIEAGKGIEAGWGIVSGLTITCKLVLSFKYKLFAGVAWWRNDAPNDVTCGKLEGGTVTYGTVKETGLPEEKQTEAKAVTPKPIKKIVVDGVTFVPEKSGL